jgi:nicotinamidase-related amidase
MNERKNQSRPTLTRRHGDVLLIIDTINDLEFPGGEKVLPWALKLASRLVPFRGRCHRAQMPVIYVNDNFGLWHSEFLEVYKHCTHRAARGHIVAERLNPTLNDYFILKPRHSAFFATSLIPLLEHLQARRLILSGIATNLCVLFTAHDAHMRQYPLVVLSDCCAAESDFDHNLALSQLERFCSARIARSKDFHFPTAKENRKINSRASRSRPDDRNVRP